jgi:hypothetical protein
MSALAFAVALVDYFVPWHCLPYRLLSLLLPVIALVAFILVAIDPMLPSLLPLIFTLAPPSPSPLLLMLSPPLPLPLP